MKRRSRSVADSAFRPLLALAVFATASCGDLFGPDVLCACSPLPVNVTLSADASTISVGDTTTITARVANPYGTWDAGVTWVVSDAAVLEVVQREDLTLTVVGLSAGSAAVSALAGGAEGLIAILVQAPAVPLGVSP